MGSTPFTCYTNLPFSTLSQILSTLRKKPVENNVGKSNFSFLYKVFHSYINLVCQNAALYGNGLKKLQTTVSNLTKNGGKFSERVGNAVGKKKLLVMTNFTYSHRVFKRLVLQTYKDKGLFGKGL